MGRWWEAIFGMDGCAQQTSNGASVDNIIFGPMTTSGRVVTGTGQKLDDDGRIHLIRMDARDRLLTQQALLPLVLA